MINDQSVEARNGGSYAASFSPGATNMTKSTNNLKSTTVPQAVNDGNMINPHIKMTTTVNTAKTIYHQTAQHRDTLIATTPSTHLLNVAMNTQPGSLANSKSPRANFKASSPMSTNQTSPVHISSPSVSASKFDLRAKLVASYTVAMNALESVTPDLLSKVGYDQAHSAIVEMHNEITRYNKSVFTNTTAALHPPIGPRDMFADAILRSGNLLCEYRTLFRKYETVVAAQGLASAQLKHTLASKQHIESEMFHIKSRLQQIQFDSGKLGEYNY